jgi:protein-serine/threonine kinase
LDYWRDENDEWVYAPTRYVKLKSLGRGTFSKVLLAEPLDLSNPNSFTLPAYMAIKLVRLGATPDASADRIQSSAKRELDILKRINHPCIARLLAYKEEGDKCLFGLGFSPGGDLFEFASRNKALLTPVLVKRVFKEIVLAVKYLHDQMHVVHRDLKLESTPLPSSLSLLFF